MCGLLSTSATLLKFLKDCTSQYNFRFIFLSSNGNIIKYDVSDDDDDDDDVKNDVSDDDDDNGDIVDDNDCDNVYLSIPLLFYLSTITMFSIYHHIYIEGEEIVENIITCRNFPDTLRLLFLLMIKIAIRATTATATTLTTTIDKNNNKVDR